MKKILSFFIACIMIFSAFAVCANAGAGQSERALIDSQTLAPLKTAYSPLDKLVDDYFKNNFTKKMDSFDKLKKCYDFLIYGSSYGTSSKTYAIYESIDKECNYYSLFDRRIAAEAYCFIKSKKGSCNDFAGAFMVMARALGFECYVIDGTISWYAGTNSHTWCLIKLGDSYYSFDPQAEWRNYSNNGYISYSNFCIPEGYQTSRRYSRSECISKFNNFKCRNKTNNISAPIPGTEIPVEDVYSKGDYLTNENMNFRTDHDLFSNIYCVIPAQTKVTVTDVYGVWGKIIYNGKTGWISLDYSTLVDESTDSPSKPAPEENEETATAKYKKGIYKTQEIMNFRASPNGEIVSTVPSGEKLNIAAVDDVWGKTYYNGTTGWVSLEYSRKLKSYTAGDVTGDNEVTAADARLVLRHSVGLESIKDKYLINSDMDADGKITAADARLVLRLVTELD